MNTTVERNPIDWAALSAVVKLRSKSGPFPEREFQVYRRAYLSRLTVEARRRFLETWGDRGVAGFEADMPRARPRLSLVPEQRDPPPRRPRPAPESPSQGKPERLPALDPARTRPAPGEATRSRRDLLIDRWRNLVGGGRSGTKTPPRNDDEES